MKTTILLVIIMRLSHNYNLVFHIDRNSHNDDLAYHNEKHSYNNFSIIMYYDDFPIIELVVF